MHRLTNEHVHSYQTMRISIWQLEIECGMQNVNCLYMQQTFHVRSIYNKLFSKQGDQIQDHIPAHNYSKDFLIISIPDIKRQNYDFN